METGYVKLWRKFGETSFYKNSHCVHLAIHLIMECNHKPNKFIFNGEEQSIERGQCITGLTALNAATGISNQTLRTCLGILEKVGFLTSKSTNKFRIITIGKYDQYQGETNKQINNQVTGHQQASNNQVTANNNDKNDNNGKNEKNADYCEHFKLFWEAYPKKVGKDDAYKSWVKIHPDIHECLVALKWQTTSEGWTKDGGKFVPNPTKWLESGRWKDESPIKSKGKYDDIDIKVF